jgi:hypothetical protein
LIGRKCLDQSSITFISIEETEETDFIFENKKKMSSKQLPPNMQQTVVSGHTFSIATKFDLSTAKILGRGSYGVVTTAFDPDRNELIAIKRIRPYANDEWDARHTLREIRLLKLLGPHPNVSIAVLCIFGST